MLEKIKKMSNLPLVIILIITVIIAIVLTISKGNKTKVSSNDNIISDESNTKEEEDIIVTEIIDEELEEKQEENLDTDDSEDKTENVNIKYFIRVNYGQNVVNIYTKDSNGEYTKPYKAMLCSTGKATPKSGTYTIPSLAENKYPRGVWGKMIGNVWAQYFTRITGSILFHSVPYTEMNKWSLEYWEYDKLGTAASLGCIRLTVQDAKWIYNNCPAGTKVEFYTDSNPGPFGKPTAQKISEEEAVRGWDPTDPDSRNPWKTYKPSEEEKKDETPSTPSNPNSENEIGKDTPPTSGGEGTESTTPPVSEGEGTGTTTPPVSEEGTGTTTPPASEEGTETTTPPASEETGTTTPPTSEETGTTTPPTSEGEGTGTTTPPASEEESETTTPPAPEGEESETTT